MENNEFVSHTIIKKISTKVGNEFMILPNTSNEHIIAIHINGKKMF